jgi:Ca-activated chloride channel family protein
MGRHGKSEPVPRQSGSPSASPPDPSRRGFVPGVSLRALGVVAALVALTVVTVQGLGSTPAGNVVSCAGEDVALRVNANPEIYPVITEAAERLKGSNTTIDGRCVTVDVIRQDTVYSVRDVSAGKAIADVWVPESTVQLQYARVSEGGRAVLPESGTSLAHSPIVLAMPRPAAQAQGWPDAQVSWASLFQAEGDVGVVDPTMSAVGLTAVLALRQIAGQVTGDSVTGLLALQRRISAVAPKTSALIALNLQAFTADERSIWQNNTADGSDPLAAVYPVEGSPVLDHPFITLSGADPVKTEAAAALLQHLTDATGISTLATHGFRSPIDDSAPFATPELGLRPQPPTALPPPPIEDIASTLRLWSGATKRGKILAVMDISGSMAAQIPGTNETKMSLARSAALDSLPLFSSDSELGAWAYSTRLDGDKPYRELVPTGPMAGLIGGVPRVEVLRSTLSQLSYKPSGGTAIFDTALAAYRKATAEYDQRKINVIVLFTDGLSEGPNAITQEELISTLRAEFNPKKPVRFITIAYGPDADSETLKQIAEATQGKHYVSADPKDIRRVFIEALVGA